LVIVAFRVAFGPSRVRFTRVRAARSGREAVAGQRVLLSATQPIELNVEIQMIGGLKTTASRLALAAAATVLASSAMAADLGGNCCADLEERVAELEATTARKGNRKVSLTVYGQINEAVMFWDDGIERNAYVVTNENSRSRFGFRGSATISSDLSAGFLLEIGVRIANSAAVNQFVDDNTATTASLDLRHSAWYLDSKHWGRIWVGQTSMATDGITEINLSNAAIGGGNSDINNWGGGFFLVAEEDGEKERLATIPSPGGTLTGLRWQDILSQANANVGEGDRRNLVRYVSPTWRGFTYSTAWGEDDFWDTSLRYANEFNGVRVAAGIGYQRWTDGNARWFDDDSGFSGNTGSQGDRGCADLSFYEKEDSDVDCWAVGMSASAMHVATGLYFAAAYGFLEDENRQELFDEAGFDDDIEDRDEHWYIQLGIERNHFGIGKTTLWVDYFHADTGGALSGGDVRVLPTTGVFDELDIGGFAVAESEVDSFGIGFVQTIDAAAMDLYCGFRVFSGEADLVEEEEDKKGKASGGKFGKKKDFQEGLDSEEFFNTTCGGRIQF
jgi:predicted porin